MKKILALVLLLGLSLGCASCSPEQVQKPTELAREAVMQFGSGDFESISIHMTPECRAQLPPEQLRYTWNLVTVSLGELRGIKDVTEAQADKTRTVSVRCDFTAKELIADFTFQQNGRIAGLFLRYGELSEQPLEHNEELEEVALEIGHGASKLRGRLTLPKGVATPPVVIIVPGSGVSDMNGTTGKAGNTPLRDLAYGLARAGVASIRFDKRYFVYPEQAGAEALTVTSEILSDASAAIELAEVDTRVDNDRIYVLGHSQGGMLAPKLAFDNQTVRGVISLAGSLRGLEEIILDQSAVSLGGSGLDSAQQQAQLALIQAEVDKIKALTPADAESDALLLGQPASYWVSLNAAKGLPYVQKLDIPFLILQGDADFQISVERDYQSWVEALPANQAYFWVYGGLNHLFLPTTGAMDITDYDTRAEVPQRVADDIAAWIFRQN